MYSYKAGTQSSVLIKQMSLFQRCPLREVPLYTQDIVRVSTGMKAISAGGWLGWGNKNGTYSP